MWWWWWRVACGVWRFFFFFRIVCSIPCCVRLLCVCGCWRLSRLSVFVSALTLFHQQKQQPAKSQESLVTEVNNQFSLFVAEASDFAQATFLPQHQILLRNPRNPREKRFLRSSFRASGNGNSPQQPLAKGRPCHNRIYL